MYGNQFLIVLIGVIESLCCRIKVHLFNKAAGFFSPMVPVHPRVFPFDGKRTLIVDPVQGPDNIFKIDISSARAGKILKPSPVPEAGMAPEDPSFFRSI